MGSNEAFADDRVRASFAKQGVMKTLGAELVSVRPGDVEITLTPRPEISQQHGSHQRHRRQCCRLCRPQLDAERPGRPHHQSA